MDYRFGRFRLLPDRRLLLADGQALAPGVRAFDLLQALIERRERIVAKAELLELVWPELMVEEANLAVQVSALRKLLGPDVIATVPGRGYRFVAPLQGPPDGVQVPQTARPPEPEEGLIGRADEMSALAERVRAQALVTVTGPGGIGKTRLALAVAAALAELPGPWADGVARIELATVFDADLLPQAVMQGLVQARMLQPLPVPSAAALADALHTRALLLVLDNCEHLLPAVAALVHALQQGAPGVHLLLTSQEPLRIRGEQVFRLPPLRLPGADEVADEGFAALALLAERARAADPRFGLDAGNREAVADICRRLDGLPLAIELAAARVRHLGVHGLRERLAQGLHLLTGGSRDALPRHQTLRAALAWSHGLLNPLEQAVLRRLGVFVGGFTLELALPVVRGEAEAGLDEGVLIDAIATLADKSLLVVDGGEPPRYRLLETMRLFALEQLALLDEEPACRARHARALGNYLADAAEAGWADGGRPRATTLRPEIDNARAAYDWAVQAQDWPLAATVAGAAASQVLALGLNHEWVPKLQRLLQHLDEVPASARTSVLLYLGAAGLGAGLTHEALLAIKHRAVEGARATGSRQRLQATLGSLGFTLARLGDVDAALAVIDELSALDNPGDSPALRCARINVELMVWQHRQDAVQVLACLRRQHALLRGEPGDTLPLMVCEANLVNALNALGQHDEAVRIGQALLARPELPGNFLHAACFTAHALSALGRPEAARALLLPRLQALLTTPIGLYSGESLAMLCLAEGRLADAVCIDATLQRHLQRSGGRLHPLTLAFRQRLQAALDQARPAADELLRWREEGELISDAAAVRRALT